MPIEIPNTPGQFFTVVASIGSVRPPKEQRVFHCRSTAALLDPSIPYGARTKAARASMVCWIIEEVKPPPPSKGSWSRVNLCRYSIAGDHPNVWPSIAREIRTQFPKRAKITFYMNDPQGRFVEQK